MVQINNVNTQKFSLNGVEYFKNFTPVVVGNKITIVNTYDSKIVIVPLTLYSDFELDAVTYANVSLLQTALLPVVFTRNTLGVTSDPSKQDLLTETNFGAFANTLSIKLTPSADDEIVTLDSITGEAVTIKYSSFGGGGGANKRTVAFRSIYNGTLNSATNSWWTTLSGLTVDGAMSIVAALTPVDNFASLAVQNPGYIVPFNCRLKSITVKGFSNTGQGDIDLALVSGTSVGVGINLINTTILSNQVFNTQIYNGIANGSGFSKVFDTGFTNYVIPKGYEIRSVMNNKNVAKNLLACVMIYEFEEEL